ncbi:LPS assembly lipoprotein LptE [Myxococcota bacterium]|nr:LPS assembly lipoprotein LptE [Myxococcota bacterium]
MDVPVAANRTREAGLESGATAAVIDALRRYGRAEIGPNSPQAVVRITLLAAEGRARAVGGGVPAAFRAVLRQEVTLEDPRTGAALWRSGPMERELDYSIPPLTSGDEVLGAEDLRRRALDALAVRLGEEAVHRMLGGP